MGWNTVNLTWANDLSCEALRCEEKLRIHMSREEPLTYEEQVAIAAAAGWAGFYDGSHWERTYCPYHRPETRMAKRWGGRRRSNRKETS